MIDEEVGWIPPNFEYDTTRIVGSHGTSANPRLCASCHVYMFEVTHTQMTLLLLTLN